MKVKKIIKIIILIIIANIIIFPNLFCKSFAFGNNGKFIKLKNVPLGQAVYYSPTEVFFPNGYFKGEDWKNATAKIYNIETQKVTDLGVKMNIQRGGFLLARLKDGRILVVGGSYKNNKIFDAEIFDPKTNKFKIIGRSNFNYSSSSSILKLDDGKIFLSHASYMEIFNPKTNNFLIVGNKRKVNSKYSYDVNSNAVYTLNFYSRSQAVKLNDGMVYIAGINDYDYNLSEIYNPKVNTATPSKAPEYTLNGIVVLNDDRVLFTSGYIYNLKTNIISKTALLNEKRTSSLGYEDDILLSNGNVLIAGGYVPPDNFSFPKYKLPIEIYIPYLDMYKKLNKKIYIGAKLINMGNCTVFVQATHKGNSYLYKY